MNAINNPNSPWRITEAFPTHPLPDSTAVPAVNKAMTAYKQARDTYYAARSESGTTTYLEDAQRLDREARADALEKGEDTNATPNEDLHHREAADHARKLDALSLIASRREKELRDTIAKHRQALIDAHRAATLKRAEKIMDLIEGIGGECAAVADDIRKREWAETFPNWPGRDRTWGKPLIVDRPRGKDVVTSADLLGPIARVLAQVLEVPEPPSAAETAPEYHITAELTGKGLVDTGPIPDDEAA